MHNDKREYVGILILAAGKGERFHGKKQDLEFHGKPLWKHCYDTANKIVPSANIIVVGRDVAGGETRSKSVLNGLRRLPKDIKIERELLNDGCYDVFYPGRIEPVLDELLISKVNKILSE